MKYWIYIPTHICKTGQIMKAIHCSGNLVGKFVQFIWNLTTALIKCCFQLSSELKGNNLIEEEISFNNSFALICFLFGEVCYALKEDRQL